MKILKTQKGITLVALVITIIVLLILAVVAIGAVRDSGIIGHAQNSADKYNTGKAEEESKLKDFEDAILQYETEGTFGTSGSGSGGNIPVGDVTILEAQADSMLSKTTNSTTYDSYGNKIVIPAGFKILVDSTTGYTVDNIDVTKGIVIKDSRGNEFVWVPVGENITNGTKTETITLSRYTFDSDTGVATDVGDTKIHDCYQELATSSYKNATAKNLSGFLSSANTNKGYYIARYEAGNENNILVSKSNQKFQITTQPQASNLSQNMYKDATTYTTDLINSYAWDTAIVFIQTFGTELDASKYSMLNKSTGIRNTGVNNDKYCNIHDMSGNALEWSTETSNENASPCVIRGGYYYSILSYYGTSGWAGYRLTEDDYTSNGSGYYISFRPILYLQGWAL